MAQLTLLLIVALLNHCKGRPIVNTSIASATGESANWAGYDSGASESIQFKFPIEDVTFCYKSNNVSILNAYWMAVMASLAYNKSSQTEAILNTIYRRSKEKYDALPPNVQQLPDTPRPVSIHRTYFASAGGQADSQGVWLESVAAAFLVFRGTEQKLKDFRADGTFNKVPFQDGHPELGFVHSGFNSALNDLWPQIDEKVISLQKKAHARFDGTRLFIGGHSLGGALASLAAARLLMWKNTDGTYKYNVPVFGLYTYGSPLIGDETMVNTYFKVTRERAKEYSTCREKISTKCGTAVARACSKLVFETEASCREGTSSYPVARFRNAGDMVTRVPYPWLGFKHLGFGMYFTGIDPSGKGGELYSEYLHRSVGRLWMPPEIEAEANTASIVETIWKGNRNVTADHSMVQYIEKLAKYFQEADGLAKAKKKDICDDELFAAEASPTSRLTFSLFDKDNSVRFEVQRIAAGNETPLSFDIYSGHVEEDPVKAVVHREIGSSATRFVHHSAIYDHRAVKVKSKFGEFAFFFDSRESQPEGSSPDGRRGCGVIFYPKNKPGTELLMKRRDSSSTCEENIAFARIIPDGTWEGAHNQ